jgi:hypothetical protein
VGELKRHLRPRARRRAVAAASCALVALAAAPLDAPAKKTHKRKRPNVVVHVLTLTQQEARRSGALRVELLAKRDATVHVRALIAPSRKGKHSKKARVIAPSRTLHLRRGTRLNYRLRLSLRGRKLFARGCKPLRVTVVARARGAGHGRAAKAARRLPSLKRCPGKGGGGGTGGGGGSVAGTGAGLPFTYEIGMASRSISTEANGKWQGGDVHLGGFGFGGGPTNDRSPATGILGDGPHVRAVSLSDGKHVFALANIEVQGWFVANKDVPYGLVDIRRAVQKRTAGALKAESVIVQSDHSHGGADPMGIWGGVPDSFRKYMFDQTVAAIIDAFQHRKPANLYYGWAPARDLQSNQFDYDESNKVMDSDMRVLQARRSDDSPIATILDFSSHPTVLNGHNTKITGDWPQRANTLMAKRFGGDAMTIVGTLGRTQPGDRGCPTKFPDGTNDDNLAFANCKLDAYAGRVVNRAADALQNATLIGGKPAIDSKTYLILDPADNGVAYVGIGVADPALASFGLKLNRALTPPWLQGNVLGTITGSVRIGDVLLSAVPGEIYPQIALKVADTVKGPVRKHGFMTAGLANDQLGYIIYPYQSYSEPILATFISRGDQLPSDPNNVVDPVGNDNYVFNVSKTLGARVTCSLLRGAGEVYGDGSKYRDAVPDCHVFDSDLALSDGTDTNFSSPGG